ncbi:28S ribosomal protein S21, mitochondrial [Trichoplax sp. H2]|uniref:Mitochondrial ribosomal protein S21 n=1 Tax=Trichoplax adhaerens TaxID=10228 RepID=B3RXI4_TRIAD|nr:hypothetical protein TRIADDRAFT_25208 [Trichoplax adhaerens]EDV24435.1 hypothetical protein TRIADDRAFT_25208 [Trichoplax adhaerens]RDD39460.1 28S ribosomal protein S21, mitochondrial [Trichoplax sp. H2]|eukprot:XP_002112325.1 hypothetical protein TRIADDRAFT_25208 [Trichoplax adhaerens]
MPAHAGFLARTVFVRNNAIEAGYKSLQRILNREWIPQKVERKRYYEKPTVKRRRLEHEKCNRILLRESKKRVDFIMARHRPSPWI